MKIKNIELTKGHNEDTLKVLIESTVFEDDRAELFVSCDKPGMLTDDPNGLLLLCYLPAWAAYDTDIEIEGTICPLLKANISIAATTLEQWFNDFKQRPSITANTAYRPRANGAAVFISGGVDSLSTIQQLTELLPADHPDRPGIAVLLDYQSIEGISDAETNARLRERQAICESICSEKNLELITIKTNFRRMNGDMKFWMQRYHGAFLAGIAHLLSKRIGKFYIASTYDAPNLAPWGSHPLLDTFFSSQHTQIIHHGIELSRLQKVRTLSGWKTALDKMNVCTSTTSFGHNCGKCEKCIRTKLELLVTGDLPRAKAFAENDVTLEELDGLNLGSNYARWCYEETLPYLKEIGREDLVRPIEKVVYGKQPAPSMPTRIKSRLKKLIPS